MHVGYHVEQAYEESQRYGHGEPYDEKSYAVQYAYDACHEGLSAKVAVHALFHVVSYAEYGLAVFTGDEAAEAVDDVVVVEQDKEYV